MASRPAPSASTAITLNATDLETQELEKLLTDVPKHLHKADLVPLFAFGCKGVPNCVQFVTLIMDCD